MNQVSFLLVVELTDFDLKKAEKAEQVAALKEQFAVIKVEEEAKKEELENNKKILLEHRERLSKMIEACKALQTHPNYPQTKGFAPKHHQNQSKQFF